MISIRPLSEDLQKKTIEDLNEDPSKIEETLMEVKEWLSKQSHIKSRTDDQFLVNFLRINSYDLEKTKERLDKHWTLHTDYPEFYKNRDIDDALLKKYLKLGVIVPLQVESEKVPRFILTRPGVIDPSIFNILEVMKLTDMISEYLFEESDHSVISGHNSITDLAGVTYKHLIHVSPLTLRKMTIFIEGSPIERKSLHFINPFRGIFKVYKLFSAFLGESYSHKIFMHETLEKFHEMVPKEILPKEYGGDGATIEEICDHWYNLLASKKNHFAENSQYGTVEILRPKSKSRISRVFSSFTNMFHSRKRED